MAHVGQMTAGGPEAVDHNGRPALDHDSIPAGFAQRDPAATAVLRTLLAATAPMPGPRRPPAAGARPAAPPARSPMLVELARQGAAARARRLADRERRFLAAVRVFDASLPVAVRAALPGSAIGGPPLTDGRLRSWVEAQLERRRVYIERIAAALGLSAADAERALRSRRLLGLAGPSLAA